ncbi:MAG TPA: hypothetical protein VMP03_15055 [Methylomirabilota bacterium]|nr:hypothetical protein [Methylomirabilota bacterium]
MKTESIIRNGKVLIRAEAIIAEIHFRALLMRSGLQLVAGLIGLFGAGMLGVAAFLALERAFGPILAAAMVGIGAIALAAIVYAAGSAVRPGRDLDLAHQLRAAATDAMMVDAKTLEAEVTGFARGIRHPLDGALSGLIVPLVSMILKTLRKPGSTADKD